MISACALQSSFPPKSNSSSFTAMHHKQRTSARYCVIWVVLPDPVSPITTSVCKTRKEHEQRA